MEYGMNSWRIRSVPCCAAAIVAATAVLLGGCLSAPGLNASDPLVVTEGAQPASPERAAAVASIRAEAQAGATQEIPDTSEAQRAASLAAREEPRSTAEVAAIEAELLLLAERRSAASDATEIAALDARARELRRLAGEAPAMQP